MSKSKESLAFYFFNDHRFIERAHEETLSLSESDSDMEEIDIKKVLIEISNNFRTILQQQQIIFQYQEELHKLQLQDQAQLKQDIKEIKELLLNQQTEEEEDENQNVAKCKIAVYRNTSVFPELEAILQDKLNAHLQEISKNRMSFFKFFNKRSPYPIIEFLRVKQSEDIQAVIERESPLMFLYVAYAAASRIDETKFSEDISRLRDQFKVPVVLTILRFGDGKVDPIETTAPYSGDGNGDAWHLNFQYMKDSLAQKSTFNDSEFTKLANHVEKLLNN
jgi:hypothetical protein